MPKNFVVWERGEPMTDREKLTEVIYSMDICSWDWAGKIADHLLANGVTFAKDTNVPSWIPVSERLPEPETDVLTFSGGCIDIITYRYNRRGLACFMFRDDCGYWKETFGKISHWMPLPEPPKEE
jgi:hypothetical protein